MRRRIIKSRIHRATVIAQAPGYFHPVGIGAELPEAGNR